MLPTDKLVYADAEDSQPWQRHTYSGNTCINNITAAQQVILSRRCLYFLLFVLYISYIFFYLMYVIIIKIRWQYQCVFTALI